MTVLDAVRHALEDVAHRLDELEAENRHLRKENASLWDSVHEKDEAITELRAMVERAHTEDA